MSTSAEELEPLYLGNARDLEDTFREMHPCFEGKETEQNWNKREKSILKLRRISRGNSPQDLMTTFLAGIKALLDGILKAVNSLRTTLSTSGCSLIQDIAKASGSGIDGIVDILLQTLIKLCATTKKIMAASSDATVNAVVTNVSYSVRIAQHMWGACQDKNTQPRIFAAGWLKTIITKHRHHKHALEHAGSLDLIEKCIRAGLTDKDPKVREGMRPTYWAFARLWSERSEAIISSLDASKQEKILDDPANPRPHKDFNSSATSNASKDHHFSRSLNSVPSKPSIRETIAAQKRARMAGKNVPERPGSAEPSASPAKSTSVPHVVRPATAMSMVGSLSSAPVRPTRPSKRPEMRRPATADPLTAKKPARPSPSRAVSEVDKSPSSGRKVNQSSPNKKDYATVKRDYPLALRKKDIASVRDDDIFAGNSHIFPRHHNKSPNTTKILSTSDDAQPSATLFLEKTSHVSISRSPRTIASRKENVNARLKVYEDPIRVSPDRAVTSPPSTRITVLEELPVNEPAINQTRLSPNVPLSIPEECDSPTLHRKLNGRVSSDNRCENPHLMRRILDSSIIRVKTRTLDVHGFRKLQGLILSKGYGELWENGARFDELLLPLLENLDSPDSKRKDKIEDDHSQTETTPTRALKDLTMQTLNTIRLLQQCHPRYFSEHSAHAIRVLLSARKYHQASSYLICGLEETAAAIINACDLPLAVDLLLGTLFINRQDREPEAIIMGMYMLEKLLQRIRRMTDGLTYSFHPDQVATMGSIAHRSLGDANAEVRRGAIGFAVELHNLLTVDGAGGPSSERSGPGFWDLVAPVGDEQKSLITYYLTRRESGSPRAAAGLIRQAVC